MTTYPIYCVETAGNQQFGAQQEALTATIQARYDSLKMSYEKPNNAGDVAKDSTVDSQEKESLIFFFHPDHLGSTSYVTGADGTVAQHVEYIPYGEVFVEERSGTVGTAYLFNAKELDDETGMYYYGARYLDPTETMWISVDPMWEKFAGMSAYNYCAGNPLKMVDPDGRAAWVVIGAAAGAVINGGIAMYDGKSGREVLGAMVSGAVSGAVMASGLGVIEGALYCTTASVADQYISKGDVSVKETCVSLGSNLVGGKAGKYANKGFDMAEKNVSKKITAKYSSKSMEKIIKKEVRSEIAPRKKMGHATKTKINSIANKRLDNLKKADLEFLSIGKKLESMGQTK